MASLWSHVARSTLAAALVACAGLADLDEPYELAKGGQGGAGGAAPACPPEILPAMEPVRPTQVPVGVDTPFFVALDRIDFGDTTDANAPCGERPLPGLDLDKIASTPTMPACQPARNDDDREQYLCDGARGVDNQNANLTFSFGPSTFLGSEQATAAAKNGEWSIVIRVSDYNGELEDDAVTVALYPTVGTATAPIWDGTDDLPIDETSVDGTLDAPHFVTSGAFVTCGLLVATIGKFPLDMSNPPTHLVLSLEGFRLIAKIQRDDASRFSLDGVMAGVWPLAQAFADLERDRILDDGRAICADDTKGYGAIQDVLCLLPDTTNGAMSISTPCDAFSFGAAFHAGPVVRPTTIVAPPSYPLACAEVDRPINNTCN